MEAIGTLKPEVEKTGIRPRLEAPRLPEAVMGRSDAVTPYPALALERVTHRTAIQVTPVERLRGRRPGPLILLPYVVPMAVERRRYRLVARRN